MSRGPLSRSPSAAVVTLLLLATPASHGAPPGDGLPTPPTRGAGTPRAELAPAARAAWETCASLLGIGDEERVGLRVRERRFGETRAMTDRILPLVLSGEKTITTTTPWVYEREPQREPRPGDYSVVLDADDAPVAVLRTTTTKTLPFDAVTEEDSRFEGAPVRPITAWREVHVRYFGRVLQPLGREWRPDMPVTLERFELVCRDGAPVERPRAEHTERESR